MTIRNCNDSIFDSVLREAFLLYERRESESIPSKADLSALYLPSERQKIRLRKLFARYRRREFIKTSYVFAKKVAAVIVISTTVVSGALITSPTVRATVAETIMNWYDEFVHFVSPSGTLSEFNPHAWIFDMPDGFNVIEDTITPNNRVVICESETNGKFILTMSPQNGNIYVDNMDNEAARYDSVEVGGVTYYMFVSADALSDNRVYWNNGNASFLISTDLPKEKMMELAQGVREKKN